MPQIDNPWSRLPHAARQAIRTNRREALDLLAQNNPSPVRARAYIKLSNWLSAKLRRKDQYR